MARINRGLWSRILSLFLCAILLLFLLPLSVWAEQASDETQEPSTLENTEENTDGSGTGTETPGTGTETPGTGTETPGTGTETPGTGTETPGTGTETPGTGTETPGTGTETPGTGTETPGTGTETPGTGTETPGTGTETPGTGTETPGTGTETPGTGTETPGTGTETPGTGTETPGTGTETPGTGTETPGTGTETPGTGTETPGTGTETPGTGTETPGTGTETPGTGTETPGTGTETPGTGTETPGTGTETPGTGTETPGEPEEPEEEIEIDPNAKEGYVIGDNVRVRSGPGTEHPPVLHEGSEVRMFVGYRLYLMEEAVPDSGGGVTPWYLIYFTYEGKVYRGYMRSDFIKPKIVAETPSFENKDFEKELAGFPEEYHAALRAIHEAHPSWHFEAVKTGLDWYYVQANENVYRRSMTNSTIISYRSTERGYDWSTDTYFPLEAGVWYQASPLLVAYHMDPRNFLDDQSIFQFEKLAFSSIQTEETIAAMLKGSFMENAVIKDPNGNDITYAETFLIAAQLADVSAFHLVTRCIQEVGWKGTACAHGNYPGYEGYYNFFNIGAHNGAEAGMVYAKKKGWDSAYEAILAGAMFIGNDYIAIGQDTPYFQKFSVVNPDYLFWNQYMTNISAAYSEARIQLSRYDLLGYLETPFMFRIPVYENMPQEACQPPTPSGSPNNYLKTLEIEGYSLTPTFGFDETFYNGVHSYNLIINGNVSSVRVNASAISTTATVTGSVGEVELVTGENVLTVVCTSASGAVREYSVTVILNGQGSSGSDVPEPPISIPSGWNPPFRIQGSAISDLTVGMDVSRFLSDLGTYGKAYATLTDENGNEVVGGAVRTGLILNYFDGTNTTQFQLVLYGDVNKDAQIDAIDLLVIRKTLLGLNELDYIATAAGDVNRDGAVDAIDLLIVRKALLGLTSITQ